MKLLFVGRSFRWAPVLCKLLMVGPVFRLTDGLWNFSSSCLPSRKEPSTPPPLKEKRNSTIYNLNPTNRKGANRGGCSSEASPGGLVGCPLESKTLLLRLRIKSNKQKTEQKMLWMFERTQARGVWGDTPRKEKYNSFTVV
jgi:hypothetical protein